MKGTLRAAATGEDPEDAATEWGAERAAADESQTGHEGGCVVRVQARGGLDASHAEGVDAALLKEELHAGQQALVNRRSWA